MSRRGFRNDTSYPVPVFICLGVAPRAMGNCYENRNTSQQLVTAFGHKKAKNVILRARCTCLKSVNSHKAGPKNLVQVVYPPGTRFFTSLLS